MMTRHLALMSLMFFLLEISGSYVYANSIPVCQISVTKNLNWNHETVVVKVVNFYTKKMLTVLTLAAENGQPGQANFVASVNQQTTTYDCQTYPFIQLQASYTPSVWSTDKGKIYLSQNSYNLKNQLFSAKTSNVSTIKISVKFPEDFVDVPMLVN